MKILIIKKNYIFMSYSHYSLKYMGKNGVSFRLVLVKKGIDLIK